MTSVSEEETIPQFVGRRNASKKIFTAGPAALIAENLFGLMPCFGRGDESYLKLEEQVLFHLRKLSGHQEIARFQSSGSGAMEIMITNFAYGKLLVIDTGFYAQRARDMAQYARGSYGFIDRIDVVAWTDLDDISGSYDWIIACYTETSIGLKLNIEELNELKNKLGAKLMLDATASIGLEQGHNLADVISYSSCKGLFGLTGAGFVAFNGSPSNEIGSFSLNIQNHLDKKMTGPYHAICSISKVLENYTNFQVAVKNTKDDFCERYKENLVFKFHQQPLLCTQISISLGARSTKSVLYQPRTISPGRSVVCHLGEVHLGSHANGRINEELIKL